MAAQVLTRLSGESRSATTGGSASPGSALAVCKDGCLSVLPWINLRVKERAKEHDINSG